MNSRDIQLFQTGATFELLPASVRLRGTLGDTTLIGTALPQKRTMAEIAAEILGQYPGLKMPDVVGSTRLRRVVMARHHIWHAIKTERPDLPNTEIGRKFKRDRTTIAAGITGHQERMKRMNREAKK